jgi:hypothetical protein
MMKKVAIPFILIAITFLLTGNLLAMQTSFPRGTIRGTVYLDANGDGRCGSSTAELPVPNVDLTFVTQANDQRAALYTGSNGTYGLPSAGQGTWVVTAVPNPSLWRVTSANPVQVTLSDRDGWVKLNVNFCVQPAPGVSVSTARLQTLPESDAAAVLQSIPAPLNTGGMSNSAISEQLLTNPPAPQPAPNLEASGRHGSNGRSRRKLADLPEPVSHDRRPDPVLQNSPTLSSGSLLHSRYMVLNDTPIAHSQSTSNPLYTPQGNQAAKNGNIFATTQIQADHTWAINFWISAPFHLTPIIDPALETVGYGNFNAPSGTFRMAAVLDVRSEHGSGSGVTYPVYFPGDGTTTWVVRHSLFEWPDPLASCPGYQRPTGCAHCLAVG